MWYYHIHTKRCHQFNYRGSQGNGNRFETEQECMDLCTAFERKCLAIPDPGMCYGYFPMWYYDVQTGKCVQFAYGGCQGNENRYTTEEECTGQCKDGCGVNEHYNSCGTACPVTCDNYDDPPRICVKLCIPGCHCDEGYVRSDDGRCVKPEECPTRAQQVCGVNEHYNPCGTACPLTCDNYRDAPLMCNKMCNPGCHCDVGLVRSADGRCVRPEQCPARVADPVLKSCLGKPDPGMCKAYVPSWYYDIRTEKCHQFVYGGCQGNGNRYATEEECMNHCEGYRLRDSSANKCELPSETGLCRGYFPRYFFNKKTGQCEKFVYGGCGGNENNFATIEDCNQACGVQSSVEVCSMGAEVGRCRGYFERYFFNPKIGQCQKFIYGGCGGNANNFETIEECVNKCA